MVSASKQKKGNGKVLYFIEEKELALKNIKMALKK